MAKTGSGEKAERERNRRYREAIRSKRKKEKRESRMTNFAEKNVKDGLVIPRDDEEKEKRGDELLGD